MRTLTSTFRTADAEKRSRLNRAQQASPATARQLRNLIEKQRAAVSQLDQTKLPRGKRARLVAKQLRLEQRFLKRSAVEIDKRRFGAVR